MNNDIPKYIEIPVGVVLAVVGSWVRSLSSNVKGKKRFAGLATSAFCGLLLSFIADYYGWNGRLFFMACAVTGWVGGDVVMDTISEKVLSKLKGGSNDPIK